MTGNMTLENSQKERITARPEMWLGALILTLPDEWRDALCDKVQELSRTMVPVAKPKIVLARG